MSINLAKSLFAVDRGCEFALFMDYVYIKKGHSVVFYIVFFMLSWGEFE